MADWLETIANRVRQKRQVDLDQAALGSELFDSLQRLLLSGETFSMNDCDVTASGAGSLDIKGTSNSLSWAQPVSVQICLVASSANRRDCILLVELPDEALVSYLECFNEDVYDTVSEIADVQRCVFSSAELPYPVKWPAEYPVEKLGVGVNFLGKVTLDDYFAERLSDACGSQPFSEKAVGLIGDSQKKEGKRERCLRLRKAPSGKLGSTEIGVFKIELQQIDLSIALDAEENPEVHVSGSVTIGQAPPFDVSAAIDWLDESVTVSFQKLPTLSTLLGLINDPGLDPLRDWFKNNLDLGLSELWIKLYWPGADAGSPAGNGAEEVILGMGFSLTTDNPIPLFGNDFKITPKLEMQISYPFSETMRTLEGTVSGKCKLGEVELEGKLAIPGWSFSAELDSKLDSLVRPLGLGTIGLPDELKQRQVKFTVSGNVPAKFYRARLEITEHTKPNEPNATWSGTGVAQSWNLTRVAIEVDYDGSNEDNKFSYWLDARLEISRTQGAPYTFDVEGGYDEGWFLSGSTESEIDVSQLINDLLQGLSLPMPKQDLKLTNVALSANFTSGDFSLSGQTAGAWTLFDGLSLNVEHFSFDKSSDGPSARILVSLTIPDIATLRLSAEKPANRDAGWKFEGSTGTGQKIPIGTLIEKGVKLFDSKASVPHDLEGFTIENLEVSFHTASKDFTYKFAFACEGKFKVNGTEVDCVVTIAIGRPTGAEKPKIEFGGKVTVGTLTFEGKFWQEDKIQALIATYHPKPPATSEDITITTLVGELPIGDAMPKLTIGLKDALFVYEKTKSAFLFGVDLNINATISTSGLGPIGSLLGGQEIGLDDLRVLVASTDFDTALVTALNERLPEGIKALPVPSSEEAGKSDGEATPESNAPIAISKGFNFSGKLKLGNLTPPPLMLPAAGAGDASGRDESNRTADTSKQSSPESSTAKWIDIKKSLGPLYLGRVGFQYQDQKIGVLLDAAVDLAGLNVALMGFRVGFPLQALTGKNPPLPEFGLDGLEIGFRQGAIEISGGLLKTTTKATENGKEVGLTEFIGTILIKTDMFTISGFGSYAEIEGQPSLFLFAMLNMDLGGPPFFHVMGLAAGFGVNRTLNLPAIEEVQEFALIKAAVKPEEFRDLSVACTAISKVTTPKAGDYWLAAGIKFTSFEMIESFIMLAVSFGTETVITVLGLSRITVPKLPKADVAGKTPVPPIACAEMALKVSFRPESGVLMAEARLTSNSYIFTKDCKLTGGFAFYAWFKDIEIPSKTPGETTKISAGDFLVTLGGYHPRFKAPKHYPIVPRLGLTWQVSPSLRVEGEIYFALTPTCLMAGGRLSASFQEGDLRAWFEAYAHFFIAWQPLQYEAEAGVRIGIAYQGSVLGISTTFSVELSADVEFWGPPFAGKADVHWTIISFTVYFGEAREKPTLPALEWGEFTQAFLPPAAEKEKIADPLTIAVVSGVIKEVKATAGNNKDYLVVNPYQLRVLVKSAMPAKTVAVANSKIPVMEPAEFGVRVTEPAEFGVRPMGIEKLEKSDLTVTVCRNTSDIGADKIVAEAVTQTLPGALWSGSPFDAKKEQEPELIGNVLTGVQFRPSPTGPTGTPQKIKNFEKLLDEETKTEEWHYWFAPAGQQYDPKKVTGHITSPEETVKQLREKLLQAIADQQLISKKSLPPQKKLQEIYTNMELQDIPVECGVGMLPQIPP